MKIIILSVGKPKEKNFSALADKYFRRIGPYVKVGLEYVSEAKDTDPARKVEREGRDILRKIRERDFVVTLDERGRETDSVSFAEWFSETVNGTDGRIVFVIGGSYGLSGEVKNRGDHSLSLSEMTMPHELCHVFLLEQLYRACTILKGVEYHH